MPIMTSRPESPKYTEHTKQYHNDRSAMKAYPDPGGRDNALLEPKGQTTARLTREESTTSCSSGEASPALSLSRTSPPSQPKEPSPPVKRRSRTVLSKEQAMAVYQQKLANEATSDTPSAPFSANAAAVARRSDRPSHTRCPVCSALTSQIKRSNGTEC